MSDARKVRQIYDALDARNPKQALKLCDASLKKAPVPLIRALKAVSLERMGKPDEATALARETAKDVVSAPPIDETVLSTLMIAFKALGLAEEGGAAYEAAWQAEPENTDLAMDVFASYMRTTAYAKAQQLAMKMFKRPRGDEYVYWAVTCIVLQADEMGPPCQPTRHYADSKATEAAAKHLQLAAAMLGRAASQGKLTAATHLRLYLEVLRRQHAHASRLQLLDEHGGVLGNEMERLRLRAEVLEVLGRHEDARAAHATLLTEHTPDDWVSHRAHIRCALALWRVKIMEKVHKAPVSMPSAPVLIIRTGLSLI